jgi:hypothetical protein
MKRKKNETLTQALDRLGPIINMAKVLRLTGLNYQTVYSKVRRKTPFSEEEAGEIMKVLAAHGCA